MNPTVFCSLMESSCSACNLVEKMAIGSLPTLASIFYEDRGLDQIKWY